MLYHNEYILGDFHGILKQMLLFRNENKLKF